ncbi:MAG: hypothetical protein QM597_03165 [Aeromicrobium sp.]|uniref:hypothetical protein n=1 Tax=Aeromicrobium sp. TaxID=1871063 RepID=UPI0039E2BF62
MGDFPRPLVSGPQFFEEIPGVPDPAEASAAGHRVAQILVRGTRPDRSGIVERVVHLVDTEGLGTLADLWSTAPADSVAGCLWRLYLLHTWVHRHPGDAAREYAAGLAHASVQNVVAGVAAPPTPDDVVTLVDAVLRGIVQSDFDVILDRASAFAHVAAVGRGQLDSGDPHSAARLLDLAQQLRHAAALERTGDLL